ncbi:hypothetical protein PR202_gb20402 [Eleusine coracana subsp. coracana]|uniref:Uncharacterized protein n=1 Tax=Eleusine coracana subsp. coracana TaxID=191504 RepID=A0AAV5FAI0_ELECO|nr:hypothetical protein PR202_gb20402 [Eleusine coracana subsp. coracana]
MIKFLVISKRTGNTLLLLNNIIVYYRKTTLKECEDWQGQASARRLVSGVGGGERRPGGWCRASAGAGPAVGRRSGRASGRRRVSGVGGGRGGRGPSVGGVSGRVSAQGASRLLACVGVQPGAGGGRDGQGRAAAWASDRAPPDTIGWMQKGIGYHQEGGEKNRKITFHCVLHQNKLELLQLQVEQLLRRVLEPGCLADSRQLSLGVLEWSHAKQSEPVTVTYHLFEQQLSQIYSRNMFKEFKETQKRSTKFTIHPNPEKIGYYFVKQSPVDTTFPWIQHEFSVKAVIDVEEPENSVFNYEYMNWEHKGSVMMKIGHGGGIAGSSTCYGVNDDYYSKYSVGDDGAE